MFLAHSLSDSLCASVSSEAGVTPFRRWFSHPEIEQSLSYEIRYERKSIIFLWITCLANRQAILGSVFHHHPDNIDQLTAQADQGLRFGFAFGYFSFEVRSGRVIARP